MKALLVTVVVSLVLLAGMRLAGCGHSNQVNVPAWVAQCKGTVIVEDRQLLCVEPRHDAEMFGQWMQVKHVWLTTQLCGTRDNCVIDGRKFCGDNKVAMFNSDATLLTCEP